MPGRVRHFFTQLRKKETQQKITGHSAGSETQLFWKNSSENISEHPKNVTKRKLFGASGDPEIAEVRNNTICGTLKKVVYQQHISQGEKRRALSARDQSETSEPVSAYHHFKMESLKQVK